MYIGGGWYATIVKLKSVIIYVIFSKAGFRELTDACSKYNTPLNVGNAVIAPAFKMTNTYIVSVQ